ncbi:hypothetical protein [Zunongwangia atlantica]|uniref:Lipoprotein n=1 Tax=Zunongwangia atlantica 22II14-10F7 TaxID=1185767 RepID=A0A1Y1T1D8_9FLAO|nr:hypothetical protein [Zunongwangia atlantica]ORL44848.1 hypothetical protein IIF7_13617 [Zunongwangia atlantica 22II14-10F7]
MKKLSFLLLMFSVLSFSSCEDDHEDDIVCCTIYDYEIFILPENADGENLIETGAITTENVKLYYQNDGNWRSSNNFSFIEDSEGQDILRFFASDKLDENDRSETRLVINGVEEFLTTEFNTENGAIITKIWLNEEVVFDTSSENENGNLIEITL